MFDALTLENFRGFKSFKLPELGRINLLVGENNSGKSSILEAIQLLCSQTALLDPLERIMTYRGEYLWEEERRRSSRELEIRHLFYGHEIELEKQFSISADQGHLSEELIATIQQFPDDKENQKELFAFYNSDLEQIGKVAFAVKFRSQDYREYESFFPLSHSNNLPLYSARRIDRTLDKKAAIKKTQLITPPALEIKDLVSLFSEVVLTPDEDLLIEALQIIEPSIERIASISSESPVEIRRGVGVRGGFVVRCAGSDQRIPIGSMGDGIWRMLGIALALVSVQGGVLLVDEIDSGLHFSTLSNLWKLIWKTAQRLDIQVFATTHNSDCWTSLASIARDESVQQDGIKIHRIEQGKTSSVVFNEREIAIAAEREIEIR